MTSERSCRIGFAALCAPYFALHFMALASSHLAGFHLALHLSFFTSIALHHIFLSLHLSFITHLAFMASSAKQ